MKKQSEGNRLKRKQEKEVRRQERRANSAGGRLEGMMAYVNEFGEIVSTPPEEKDKPSLQFLRYRSGRTAPINWPTANCSLGSRQAYHRN